VTTPLPVALRLPLSFSGDFAPTLRTHLSDFLKAIEASLTTAELAKASLLANAINNAVGCYLRGHPRDAYDALEVALTDVAGYLNAPAAYTDGPFFRMRVAHHRGLSAAEMFHIPFELRGLVAPQRFSINGLPFLYTARSLYVCWEELGRPPLSSVQASVIRRRAGQQLRLLRLAPTSPGGPSARDWICYPLMAACTVRSRREHPFRPEYIVPQLVLQWLTRSDDFDGIECISTHASMDNDPALTTNAVFPVRNVAASGHCSRLTQLFEITEPLAWEFVVASGLDAGGSRPSGRLQYGPCTVEYNDSLFAYVESLLNGQPAVCLASSP